MVMKKIISTLLAVLMLASALTLVVGAQETETKFVPEYNTNLSKPTMNYVTGALEYDNPESTVISSPEEKLATMDCRLEANGYQLYVDAYSGEVGVKSLATGEILLTNPYDLGKSKATYNTKLELLSQLVVNFKDIATGQNMTYNSAEYAIAKAYQKSGDIYSDPEQIQTSQIIVKNIKNGLRVEYSIGREQSKMLVPRVIEKTSFETKILEPVKAALEVAVQEWTAQYVAEGMSEGQAKVKAEAQKSLKLGPLTGFYKLYDPESAVSEELKEQMYAAYPITKKMSVYVLNTSLFEKERARIEQIIKEYAPNYTYEDMDADHLLVEYVDQDKNPPLFKMALEYTLDESGLSVRLPANGIRFNESLYELISIDILPYMGSSLADSGYTFFPDGSGTLFDFEDIKQAGANVTVSGKVYGTDYAYHTISGAHQETIRYPVFGMTGVSTLPVLGANGMPMLDEVATAVQGENVYLDYQKEQGYLAIVEEGGSMMELITRHEVTTSGYNAVRMRVYPRPQDTYNVADAISVSSNDTWTVVSSRKYTGNYKLRYVMLTPDEEAANKKLSNTFDTSYLGMAKAYRAYLEGNGILTKLTEDKVNPNNIPLYIETFGAMQTTEKFLSIPFEVMTPLTTFADINTMYDDLANQGVENINFILTGFTKGGLSSPKAPYHLKWENAVKDGGMDFDDLTAVAKEKGFGVFPDFDFAFIKQDTLFDGVSLKKHAVKTIDDRYTSKREYSATKQTYISYYELALSPAYFSHFYEKLTENYLEHDPIGISVSTLGSYLNSDFDETEPYNRADAEAFTVEAFAYLRANYNKVMTSGGNAYSWKYVNYITDIALDSSRYSKASASVPFLGIVLHGYVEYAGTPINMEGNIDYALLKAIESGAGLQFILSYRNTENLKEDKTLSQYYSIKYEIWLDDIVALYNELNSVLKGVQTSAIVEHTFLNGTRVPDNDELAADALAAIQAAIESEKLAAEAAKKDLKNRVLTARNLLKGTNAKILSINTAWGTDGGIDAGPAQLAFVALQNQQTLFNDTLTAWKNLAAAEAAYKADPTNATLSEAYANALAATADKKAASYELNMLYEATNKALDTLFGFTDMYVAAAEGLVLMQQEGAYENERAEQLANLAAVATEYQKLLLKAGDANTIATNAYAEYHAFYADDAVTQDYVYETDDDETDSSEDKNAVAENKYASDANKIVYEEYENGTAFILNFNNYAVVVTNPKTDITYTIEAYGYVFLKPQTNA